MTEIKRTLILEVREGVGTPDSIALEVGRPTNPLSVGTEGDWKVVADGVLDLHVVLMFDGARLYAQSVVLEDPAYVEGSPLGEAWTEIVPPSTLAVGTARIMYRAMSEDFDDKTEVTAPPSMQRALSPAAFSHDEVTRIEPLRRFVAPPGPGEDDEVPDSQAKTKINAPAYVPPAYAPDLPTLVSKQEPTPTPRPPATVEAPIDMPPPPSTTPTGKRKAARGAMVGMAGVAAVAEQWREASLVKKALVLLLPLAIVSMLLIFREERPAARGSAKAAESASGSMSSAGSVRSGSVSASGSVSGSAPPAVAPSDDSDASSLERAAADAVAAGAYADAIRIYDALAAAHPDRAVYREAARILRAKIDAAAP